MVHVKIWLCSNSYCGSSGWMSEPYRRVKFAEQGGLARAAPPALASHNHSSADPASAYSAPERVRVRTSPIPLEVPDVCSVPINQRLGGPCCEHEENSVDLGRKGELIVPEDVDSNIRKRGKDLSLAVLKTALPRSTVYCTSPDSRVPARDAYVSTGSVQHGLHPGKAPSETWMVLGFRCVQAVRCRWSQNS